MRIIVASVTYFEDQTFLDVKGPPLKPPPLIFLDIVLVTPRAAPAPRRVPRGPPLAPLRGEGGTPTPHRDLAPGAGPALVPGLHREALSGNEMFTGTGVLLPQRQTRLILTWTTRMLSTTGMAFSWTILFKAQVSTCVQKMYSSSSFPTVLLTGQPTDTRQWRVLRM